jgi:hypothetical protein
VTEAAPESIEDYYARILAATDDEGRLPVAVEEMPGWDIYPYELDSLRLKPLRPLADADPARRGERAQDCWCTQPPRPDDGTRVWRSERWVVHLTADSGLPIGLTLSPLEHHDLTDLPEELAGEMGRLITVISAAVEQVPSVGRVQLAKYGDGGAPAPVLLRPADADPPVPRLSADRLGGEPAAGPARGAPAQRPRRRQPLGGDGRRRGGPTRRSGLTGSARPKEAHARSGELHARLREVHARLKEVRSRRGRSGTALVGGPLEEERRDDTDEQDRGR